MTRPSLSQRSDLDRVIWLAGAGRSGTTWLGKIFDAAPNVLYRHEPDNTRKVPFFAEVPSRIDPEATDPSPDCLRDAIDASIAHESAHFVRPPYFRKDYRGPSWWFFARALRSASRFGGIPRAEIPRWMWRGDPQDVRPVIKSVSSNLKLAWMHRHVPELRLVLIVRHPGGYLASWLRGRSDRWVPGQRSRLDPTLLPIPRPEHAHLLDQYERGTDFDRELIYWLIANETPLLQLGGAGVLHTVVYEDLCADPERVAREVFAQCDLDFTPSVADFLQESTSRHDSNYHAVFKDPARTAWAWRDELSVEQRARVDEVLRGSTLSALWEPIA